MIKTVTVYGLRAANVARQAEWDPSDKISLSFRLNELAGETGEACNVGKKIERERLGIRGSRDTLAHLGEELADVVICADLVAMSEGIDLDAAIEAKFNATSEKVGLSTRLSLAAAPKADPTQWLADRAADILLNGNPEASKAEPVAQFEAGWKALQFFKAIRSGFWGEDWTSLDGGDFQDLAQKYGLIVETKFDPSIHAGGHTGVEEGDSWFVSPPDVEAAIAKRKGPQS